MIFFPGALGDFLCFLPVADAVRRAAGGRVTLVTHPAYRPLLDEGQVELIDINRREVSALFSSAHVPHGDPLFGGFRRSFSWMGSNDANFGRNLRAITFGTVEIFPFKDFRSGLHATDHFARCAGIAPVAVPLSIGESARRWARAAADGLGVDAGTLVLHAGSGSAGKNWDGMSELAGSWRRRGGRVVAIIGPADRDIDGCDGFVSDQPLDHIAAFLALAPFFVGNDSGVSHLAAAVSCRGIALFGDTDPTIWHPRGAAFHCMHAPEICTTCGPQRLCTHRIGVHSVLRQVDRMQRESYRPSR